MKKTKMVSKSPLNVADPDKMKKDTEYTAMLSESDVLDAAEAAQTAAGLSDEEIKAGDDEPVDIKEAESEIGFIKLTPELKAKIKNMKKREFRYVLDALWQTMMKRIASNNQLASLERAEKAEEAAKKAEALAKGIEYKKPDKKKEDSHAILEWISKNARVQERYLNTVVREYVNNHVMGRWALQFRGIGHVIAGTLVGYIDPEKAQTGGDVFSIFGLNPQQVWLGKEKADAWVKAQDGTPDEILALAAQTFHRRYESMYNYATKDHTGKKVKLTLERVAKTLALRPWNAKLKVRAYHIGACFMREKNKPDASPYSRMYVNRKAREILKNNNGDFAQQAKDILEKTPKHKQRAILKTGKLSPGHIDARARRYAVKQFLQDFQQEYFRQHFGQEPPAPYPIALLGHAHFRVNPQGQLPHGQLPGLSEPLPEKQVVKPEQVEQPEQKQPDRKAA